MSGLQIKSNFGYTTTQVNQTQVTPLTYYNPAQTNNQSSSSFGINNLKTWIVEPQLAYKKVIAKGSLDVLFGTSFQQQTQNSNAITGTGYSSDALLQNLAAATTITLKGVTYSLYKYNAIFGRVNYLYQDKYIVNLTARRDGSSRFGPGSQFANFGAVGAAWIFSKETIVQNNFKWLSFGKLRLSYGLTGNDQIGDYKYLNTYNPITGINYLGITTLAYSGLPNPKFGWETTKKFEAGLDLGCVNDRVLFGAVYYRSRSSNLLVNYPLPSITGGIVILENFPAIIQNSGLELTINTVNIQAKNFSWHTSLNLTIPLEVAKLVSYPNFATSSYANSYVIGKSTSITKVLHATGVDPQSGVYTFFDYDHDGKIAYPNDWQSIVSNGTQFYGGISNSIQYKGIQLDVFFQFARQDQRVNMLASYGSPGIMSNVPEYAYSHSWQAPGDHTPIQRFSNSNVTASTAFGNFSSSDGIYSNASYCRLKNLALSYQLPIKLKNVLHIQTARIYLQGQNLFTFSNYIGLDPENQGAIPPLRVLTAGIQLKL